MDISVSLNLKNIGIIAIKATRRKVAPWLLASQLACQKIPKGKCPVPLSGILLVVIQMILFESQRKNPQMIRVNGAIDKISLGKFIKAASEGDSSACIRLSDYYGFVKNDEVQSRFWTLRAAELGSSVAQYNMASLLIAENKRSNFSEIVKWLELSKANGDPTAGALLQKVLDNENKYLKSRK